MAILQQLGDANLSLGAADIGVSVVGFVVMSTKIERLKNTVENVGNAVDALGVKVDAIRHDFVAADLDDLRALASFANFFASTAGSSLRLEAIRWIEKALDEDQPKLRGNAGSALADLAQALLAEHGAKLVINRASRQALNNVIGRMVRDQAPYALTLQDRARTLR